MAESNIMIDNDVLESCTFNVTKAQKCNCYYQWRLCDLNEFIAKGSIFKSGFFPSECDGMNLFKNAFQLSLYGNYISLTHIFYPDGKEGNFYLKGSLLVTDLHEVTMKKFMINSFILTKPNRKNCVPAHESLDFHIDLSKLDEVSENGIIIILNVTVTLDDVNSKDVWTNTIIPKYHPEDNLGDLLFKNKQFTDITVNVQDKQFKAHKAVLVACSPVFAAMLHHDMKEKIQSQIDISDIDPIVFEEILRFMYTKRVMNLDNLVVEIFIGANKYQIEELQIFCQTSIYKNLTIDNVLHILNTAELNFCKELMHITLAYIKLNANAILKSEKYKLFVQKFPNMKSLLTVILEQML